MPDRNTKISSRQIFDGGVKFKDLADNVKVGTIGVIFDNGGSAIDASSKIDVEVPFNATITNVTLLADTAGSIVIDIYKDTYANFAPSTSITASAKPTISSSDKSKDSTLSGWTTTITAGDILRFNVDSVTDITRCLINLTITRT